MEAQLERFRSLLKGTARLLEHSPCPGCWCAGW